MTPTSDEVATAIIAACRETGAAPEDVVTGAEREAGVAIDKAQAISRARAYAGFALDKVFNRPTVEIPRSDIARLIGVNKPTWGAFFSSLEQRKAATIRWWDDDALKRVVDAVMECEPGPRRSSAPKPAQNITENIPARRKPTPYKHGPLPAPKASLDHSGGFRPAPGTYEKALAEDADDDASVFDRGSIAPNIARRQIYAPPKSKREMDDDLRRAVENTAAKTPAAEPGDSGN